MYPPKIENRDKATLADSLHAFQSNFPLFCQRYVVLWYHARIADELAELLPHLVIVRVQQVRHGGHIKFRSGP